MQRFTGLGALIRSDVARYTRCRNGPVLRTLLLVYGARATAIYRVERALRVAVQAGDRKWLPLYGAVKLVSRSTELRTGIGLPPSAGIGEGLYVGHFGGIVVGGDVSMGRHCAISQGVTLGVGGRGDRRGSPSIGDRVYIAPGAKVFGPIVIGNDVAIGANAVVTSSLPDRAVAVGVPARVISYEGSFDFVTYVGMDEDEERSQSIAQRGPAGT